MKRYTWKLAVSFVISYLLLMVVVVFAYTTISQNFILTQAKNNLIDSVQTSAARIDSHFSFDHEKLSNLIDEYELLSLDPLEQLNLNRLNITVNGINFTGFGTISGRELTIGTDVYTYTQDFDAEDYDQNITIYSFNDAFNVEDIESYIFFKVGEIVGYVESDLYLDSISNVQTFESKFAVMTSENTMPYRDFEGSTIHFFYDYLRADGYSENSIDQVKEVIAESGSIAIQTGFLGVPSFIVLAPLDLAHSVEQLYIIHIINEDLVVSSMSYLTNILWALFFVIFLLFALAMMILFRLLEQKVNDIENAKITHYYAKPYIVRINSRGAILSYNQSFRKFLGEYDIYDKITDFRVKKDIDSEPIQTLIHRQSAFTALFELGLGKVAYVHFVPVRTTGGHLLIGDDITDIEGKFDEYKNLALYNPVTKLPNQNSLKQDLHKLFDDKEMLSKTNSLLAFDIVSFSKINLLLGEKSGDRFLSIVSELVKQSLEGYPSSLYNMNADTFFVLFRDIENYNWVTRWTTKILSILEKPITIDRNLINIEIKIGIFHMESDRYEIFNPDVCFDNVMLALNHAKESSAHKTFTYDVSLSLIASREQRMELDLANGIKNQEFQMVLQPQYSNAEERIIGFEALIRWTNPKYSSESPLKFIKMAEKNNMIIDIGRIALHETFSIAKEFERYNVQISLNISPVQLLQAGFVNEIISVFEQYELKRGSVALEITETFLISSFELVINKLKLLEKHGFSIHLDDFGSGYSSLQYLKDLPVNTIKIDKAFIDGIENDAHSRAIVTMISSLAKNIGLEVIAEGIENEKQNQMVYKSGCNIIQGYFISRPVPKIEAIKIIQAYNIDKSIVIESIKQIKLKESKR